MVEPLDRAPTALDSSFCFRLMDLEAVWSFFAEVELKVGVVGGITKRMLEDMGRLRGDRGRIRMEPDGRLQRQGDKFAEQQQQFGGLQARVLDVTSAHKVVAQDHEVVVQYGMRWLA